MTYIKIDRASLWVFGRYVDLLNLWLLPSNMSTDYLVKVWAKLFQAYLGAKSLR